MRRRITVLGIVLLAGIGLTGAASASTDTSAQTSFTCAHFQDPTVEFVWSHVCRF